jgi:hypothetical protein
MKLTAGALAAVLLFAARATRAESPIVPHLTPRAPRVEALTHFGVATAPFGVPSLREAKGQAFLLSATGSYAISESLALELRAPFVLGSVAQPAGSYVDAAALGNPQLGARARFFHRHSAQAALELIGRLELGVPLASYAPDLMPNRVLAIADGIEGRGHPEWFVPGVVPLTASTSLQWSSANWLLQAELRLPLFVRVSEADLPSAVTNTRRLGLIAVLGTEARYRLSRRLSLAAAGHLALDFVAPVEQPSGVSPLQDFERLSLHVHFGPSAALVVDLQTAIAGELGGNTVGGGLRAAVTFR